MPNPIPLRGTSLHDGVAARLRGRVFRRPLAPGEFVDEEALQVLAAEERFPVTALHEGCCALEAATKASDAERAERAMHDQRMAPLAASRRSRQGEARTTRAEGRRHAR